MLDELRRVNPTLPETGRRRDRHHQWFTPDPGHPKLKEHLARVMTIMALSKDWPDFKRKLEKVLPKIGDTGQLDLDEDD